ncbi:MAG: Glutamine--tRNA ligase [Pseudomonadota bacterium]
MSTANDKVKPTDAPQDAHKVSNFLRQIIESDLTQGTYAQRKWAGSPGDALHHAAGSPDPAKIRTPLPTPPKFAHVFRPSRMAICTSAMPKAFA